MFRIRGGRLIGFNAIQIAFAFRSVCQPKQIAKVSSMRFHTCCHYVWAFNMHTHMLQLRQASHWFVCGGWLNTRTYDMRAYSHNKRAHRFRHDVLANSSALALPVGNPRFASAVTTLRLGIPTALTWWLPCNKSEQLFVRIIVDTANTHATVFTC